VRLSFPRARLKGTLQELTFAYPTQANNRLDPDFLYAYPFDGSVCGFL
jgi:hypothetical protein